MFKYCFLVFFCLYTFQINAQPYELSFQFKNGNSKGALVGKRFGDKIFLEDSISGQMALNPGFYSCIQNGNILFDFMVVDKNLKLDYDFMTKSTVFNDPVNEEFFASLSAVQDSPAVVQSLSPNVREIMKTFYPQIEVSQRKYMNHKSLIDSTLLRSLKYENLLFNSPFLSQALDFVFGKCVSPDYDSSYYSCNRFLSAISDENMHRYVLNWMLYHYETSKVLGSENVFIDLALNHLKPILTPSDTNGYEVLGKAESLNPNRIGTVARDFRFKNIEKGQVQSLHDLDGLFKIIFFYDPDCHHCKEVFPKVQALHDSIIDRGVSFLAMSVTPNENDVREFKKTLSSKNSSVRFGYEENSGDFVGKYYIPVTPGIYILDANNRVKARGLSLVDLRELMKTFIGSF